MRILTILFAAAVFLLVVPAFAQSPTRTQIFTSPSLSTAGQSVMLRAEVDGLGGGAPTGRLRLSDNGIHLGAANLTTLGAGVTNAGAAKRWRSFLLSLRHEH